MYTLKRVGGEGHGFDVGYNQSQPSRQLLRLGRVVLVERR